MDELGVPAIAGLLAVPVGAFIFVAALALMGRRWAADEPVAALADLGEDGRDDGDGTAPHTPRTPYGLAPHHSYALPRERPSHAHFPPYAPARERPPSWFDPPPRRPYGSE